MKPFFKVFFIALLPLLIFVELSGFIFPKNTPYGVFIIGRLIMTLIGTIIAISRLKRKYKLVNFGKSFFAGAVVIFSGFVITTIVYFVFVDEYYHYHMAEVIGSLLMFMLGQVLILLMVLMIAGRWYATQKAGLPGFSMLIPIYGTIVMLQIAKKPIWWIVMLMIPIANIVFMIMILNGVSKQFGKSEGFTVGLVFLGGIFWAILGYDDSRYSDQVYELVEPNVLNEH